MENKKVVVEISFTGNNFCAYIPQLPGCVATGETPEEIKQNIAEAVAFHVEGSLKDRDPLPKIFKGTYRLTYKFDAQSLLKYYKGTFTNAAMERLTGINQGQLSHYLNGIKKPRTTQVKKIQTALHKLGQELVDVEL